MPQRDSLSSEDRLRERYEALKQLRETQPERDATQARQVLEKTRAASDALIESLRAEIAAYKENQQPAPSAGKESAGPSEIEQRLREENTELRRQLAERATAKEAPKSEEVIAFYEMMTGMSVELVSANRIARCAIGGTDSSNSTGVRRAVFEVHLAPADADPNDVEYVPTDLGACAEHLPEYLQDSIMFERSQAPAFLQKLLSGVAIDE